jgi:peptide/nickel transport system substrate-binding protein
MEQHRGPARALGRRAVVVLVGVGLLAAACGGGGGKKAASTATSTSEPVTTTSEVAPASGDATPTTATAGATTTTQAAKSSGSSSSATKKPTSSGAKTTVSTVVPRNVSNVATNLTNVTAAPTTAPNASIEPGGTLTFMKVGELASMDPTQMINSGGDDGPQGNMVYDYLLYTNTKDGSLVPQTAQSLTSTDAVVWTMKLRPNIKFSDGTPYDAAAVKFNWERLQDPKNAAKRANTAAAIAQMDVLDAQTLRITLKAKNAVFPIAVTLMPFVGSPTAIQANPTAFASNPVGAGPFLMKSWQRDNQMVFVRNPNYWNAPQPYLDQVIVKPIPDETQRINSFLAGQAQAMFVGGTDQAQRMEQSGSAAEYPMVLNGGKNVYFNLKNPPFNDLRVRQAFTMALDPKDYAKTVDLGMQRPFDSAFRPDSPFYDPTILQLQYDPVKAQQLFDAYVAEKGPLNITLSAFAAPANYALAAQYVQGKLNTYKGVHVELLSEAPAQHATNCLLGNYQQACLAGIIWDDPEPQWTAPFLCTASPNATGWCNQKFDAAVADNRSTLDPQQRIADIKEAQRQFYADIPTMFLDSRYSWYFAAKNVMDFAYADDGTPRFGVVWFKH